MRELSFDARAFPRVAAYLQSLPAGFASHARAASKASLCVSALNDKPLEAFAHSMPGELVDIVTRPPLVSSWLPAVATQALFLAIADAYSMTDDAFEEWSRRLQRTLLSGPLYRALAVLPSPTLLLQGAEKRWRSFHRGSTLEVKTIEPGRVLATVKYPSELYTTTNLRGFAGGFVAVGELSRARDVRVKLRERTATAAVFDVRWAE